MNWFSELLTEPSVLQAVIYLSLICSLGLALGQIKIKGVSLGVTLVFFAGILLGHISDRTGLRLDPQMVKLKMDNKLEPLEYRVCVLVKLGMKVNEIIYLTDTTNSRISMMRSRLHKRLFGESGGAKDFDQKMAEL